MELNNEAKLVAELDREIAWIDAEVERILRDAERRGNELLERKARLKVTADAVRPRTIQIVDAATLLDDRGMIHAAVNAARKELGGLKGISLERRTTYDGDKLVAPTYVSFPVGDDAPLNAAPVIVNKLQQAGFPVEWNGNAWSAIIVHPKTCELSYYKVGGWNGEPEGVAVRPVRYGKGW